MTYRNTHKLRERAEQMLSDEKIDKNSKAFKDDLHHLLEELSIHQIEIELQNEELRRTQTELNNAYSKFEDLFNNAPAAYFKFDNGGIILEINDKGEQLLATPARLLTHRPFITFLKKEQITPFYTYIRKIFKEKQQSEEHFTIKNSNGQILHLHLISNLLYDHAEQIYYCRTIALDLTEKIKIENALKQSEKKYRELSDNIAEGIYQTENGYLKSINRPFARMFGYSSREMIDMPSWKLAVPEKREEVRRLFMHKARNRDSTSEEVQCIRRDGSVFWAEIKMSIFLQDMRIFGTVSDITARKQAEQQLRESEALHRLTLSNISDAVFLTDKQLIFTYICPNVHFIFGYTEEEVWQMGSLQKLVPQMQAVVTTLEDQNEVKNLERKIVNKDGKELYVLMNAKWVNISRGGLLFTLHDITGRKKAQEELRQYAMELKELNATKDKFFSIVAHDLKNPFNTLLGYSELLLDFYNQYNEQERKKFIKAMHDSSKQTYALLENLLIWSRTQTNRIPFNPEKISLRSIINENLNFTRATADKKGIQLGTNMPGDIQLIADRDMLNTVLRNLLSNAIKFTPENGSVTSGFTIKTGQIAEIFVSDTGVGIPEEKKQKLFRIDEHVSSEGTAREHGTGIGLILCKEFVERHGGEIQVSSTPGAGTTFSFTLETMEETDQCKAMQQEIQRIGTIVVQNPHLKEQFCQRVIPQFRDTYKAFSSWHIQRFASTLDQTAQQFQIEELKTISKVMLGSIEQFNITQLNSCFAEFEHVVKKIEQK